MARRVFFSFHYQRDIWRVNQIRKQIDTDGDGDEANGGAPMATPQQIHDEQKRRRLDGRDQAALHCLPQRLAAISCAASAWPASFQWPKPALVFGKPCK